MLPGGGGMQQEMPDSVSKACAYGQLDRISAFLETDPSSVNRPDESGYYPLQWAALNNRAPEATFLLQRGALVNAVDPTGQTALHWAAVRGNLAVMEVLLAGHADYELRDTRGYNVCHVAAQYGQTAVLYLLALKWGVNVDLQDNDGRTPLHWAAYKGYADTVRLLLVLDARYTLADHEGCTPLHWAAIKGNGEAAEVLLQGGSTSVLTYKDVTGSTPPKLALEKGHRYLSLHLAEYKKNHSGRSTAWLSSTQLCPVIWFLVLSLVALYSYKVISVPLLPLGAHARAVAWLGPIFCLGGLILLYKTSTSDPGFIKTGWDTSAEGKRQDEGRRSDVSVAINGHAAGGSSSSPLLDLPNQLKALDSPALWAGNWHQICVSCHIVRPLRAKHDSVTDRCIEVFDHYCPWVGNAIGKGNRHLFLMFLIVELIGIIVAAVVGILQIRRALPIQDWGSTGLPWMILFLVGDLFMGMSTCLLAVAQINQVGRNVTTNELANWHRYRYLQSGHGFHNPFNHGCYANCVEAFHPETTPMAPLCIDSDMDATVPPTGAVPMGQLRLPVSSVSGSWGGGGQAAGHGGKGHVHGPGCQHHHV